jgi:hypothetical protein
VKDGLVKKMSLTELAKTIKDRHPEMKDEDDAKLTAEYLKSFPNQLAALTSQDQEAVKNMNQGDPQGYYKAFGKDLSLDNAPGFTQKSLQKSGTKLDFTHPEKGTVAHVDMNDLSKIHVDQPSAMDKPIMAHEATHIFQGNLKEPMSGDAKESFDTKANYDYGGWQGLVKANEQHRHIRDFTDEQQAKMVGDYVELEQKMQNAFKEPPEKKLQLLKEWDLANQAMRPYVKQMQGQEMKWDKDSSTISTKPDPPPAPPAELTGIAIPLEGIGGKAAYLEMGLVPKEKKKK